MDLLIDTSIIIDFLRRKETESILTRIIQSHKLKLSIITVGELYSGLYAEKQKQQIEQVLNLAEILTFDIAIAKLAGEIRRSAHLALTDAFIAATAIDLQFPLATLNTKDFKKVKGLQLYKF